MIDFFRLLVCALTRLFRSRARLEVGNPGSSTPTQRSAAQIAKRVAFGSIDRLVFVALIGSARLRNLAVPRGF